MTASEFLRTLEEALEVEQSLLVGPEQLDDLECWDSMSALTFMALADEKLEVELSGEQVLNAKTVNDLLALLGDKLTR